MSFEWRTDEERGWQKVPPSVAAEKSEPFWRRSWRLWLVLLAAFLAGLFVVRWQINQQIAAATSTVELEVLAAHNFFLQSAGSQDEQLFQVALSGRNPYWGEIQKNLVKDGLLLDRPMLGWQYEALQPQLTKEEVSIEIAPDFRAAELLYPQTYTVQSAAGVTETITLQQTALYRLGQTRWLYAPPFDEFWGDWVTQRQEHLTLVYPQRDAHVAQRLAADLDSLLAEMCTALVDLRCDEALNIHLRLDRDPESLLELNQIESILSAGLRLNLPTPTLLGLPTDEISYDYLYKAYGVQLATAFMAHQIDYGCCRHQLFFRALRDYQLAQLGLLAWPIDQDAYSDVLADGFSGDASRHWTRRWHEVPPQWQIVYVVEEPEPIFQQVYLWIEFLAARPTAVSPLDMMRLMQRNSFDGWLDDVLAGDLDKNMIVRQFLHYIYENSAAGQLPKPPLPLPHGQISLICDVPENGRGNRIVRYDLAENVWSHQLFLPAAEAGRHFSHSVDGERFIISSYDFSENESRYTAHLVTDDSVILLEELEYSGQTELYANYYFAGLSGDYFIRSSYEENAVGMAIFLRATECPTADCPELPLPGWPILSPDGRHLLGTRFIPAGGSGPGSPDQEEMFLGSLASQTVKALGQGSSPTWLNEATYAFWQRGEAEGLFLATATIDENRPRALLTLPQLLEKIPVDNRPEVLFPGMTVVHPQNSREILLLMLAGPTFGPERESFLYKVVLSPDLSSVDSLELWRFNLFAGGISYSPDGRYITVADFGFGGGDTSWTVLDSESGAIRETITTQLYNLDWSTDGRWFVQGSENYLMLRDPANDYQYLIPHGLENCRQAFFSGDD